LQHTVAAKMGPITNRHQGRQNPAKSIQTVWFIPSCLDSVLYPWQRLQWCTWSKL